MELKKFISFLAIIILPIPAYSQVDLIFLKCQRISETADESMVEISLKRKTIVFDSIEERELWDDFNRFLRSKDLQTFPFRPVEYKITRIGESEIIGVQTGIFPIHGKIKINRNTLFVDASLYRKNVKGGVFDSSYKCEKTSQGF